MNKLLTIAILALLSGTNQVYAYEAISSSSCSQITFSSPPRLIFHISEIVDPDASMLFGIMAAMGDIHTQFNLVGATSAEITHFEISEDPFILGDWFSEITPTIHVGFSADPSVFERDNSQAAAITGHPPRNAGTCEYQEAHIVFQDPSLLYWAWGVPSTYGEDFYNADEITTYGLRYFRPAYLHELLHAFGLGHTENTFAMMNYASRPWSNRDVHSQVRPLPDDVEGLRDLYPSSGVRREVGLFNTWYDSSDVSNSGAAYQKQLCRPSTGTSWGDKFGLYCGQLVDSANGGFSSGSSSMNPGDFVRTQVTVGNYGTSTVEITHSLYFSRDEQWHPDVATVNQMRIATGAQPSEIPADLTLEPFVTDTQSVTVYNYSLDHSSSIRKGLTFRVPNLSSGFYYVIARISATTPSGHVVSDWIPLSGGISIY
jgi:hypothetical protein